MKGVVISVFVMVAMVQFMVEVEGSMTCEKVTTALTPCLPYLTTGGGVPSQECCTGVGNLQKMARSTTDRQVACDCAKQSAARIPAIREDAAASLPAKCNLPVDFPISKTTDCTK
ncbi:Plant lipid transfer protein/Par allergen [Corchorus olitorius]|uniref:Non-specific lipid-transfer protein n=1 Tax=Corchorus olitorius TaxID=93759 RepID=A0A1R3II13_9ROSI|nr:Plant lipid transfer protein/Par allergen [Corchorus olitorius]